MYRTELKGENIIDCAATEMLHLQVRQDLQDKFDVNNFEATVIITDVEGKRYSSKQKVPGRNEKYDTPIFSDPDVDKQYVSPLKKKKREKRKK